MPASTASSSSFVPSSPAKSVPRALTPSTNGRSEHAQQHAVQDLPPLSRSHTDESGDYMLRDRASFEHDPMPQLPPTHPHPYADNTPRELPPLQANGALDENDKLDPVAEDDPASYNLVAPAQGEKEDFSLEKRSQQLFSKEHLQVIFADPSLLLKFTSFLGTHRPQSVPALIHYLDALKALRTLHYANAICEGLEPIDGLEFTQHPVTPTKNTALEARANAAFDILVREELAAFVTHQYIQIVSESITNRITGALSPHLREASEGLAEVFCLTDPSRSDNPIVFASEEFNRTTQYGMSYILGRNCRFLQGPGTNPLSVKRFRDTINAGKPHQEVFLNYRRDGSPFMNLLMCAPLCDSRGIIRYFIGAQVDVSGLVKDCVEMESLERLLELQSRGEQPQSLHLPNQEKNDELRELAEMLNQGEMSTIRRYGGRMHREAVDEDNESFRGNDQARLLIKDPGTMTQSISALSGKLSGIYQHYLLVRPYPALRILFASPSQRVPGILQSPFLKKIGGSNRVRDELTAAFAEGRGVTAKVRWVSKSDEEGRNKWIHCTPLIGSNGQVGVWMVVIVDDQKDLQGNGRKWRMAPPVTINGSQSSSMDGRRSAFGGIAKRNGFVGTHGMNGYGEADGTDGEDGMSLSSLRI